MINAFTVCVDYSDLLKFTIEHNRRFFNEYMVITSCEDKDTWKLCSTKNVFTYVTDAFTRDEASFNKGLAIEEALKHFPTNDWLCSLDADIILPGCFENYPFDFGCLYVPYRRICKDYNLNESIESLWEKSNVLREIDFAGYTQVFHGEDPILKDKPWYGIDWLHAGGYDTDFNQKWSNCKKKRPPFEVLHLGEPYKNWWGKGNYDRYKKMVADRCQYDFKKEKIQK